MKLFKIALLMALPLMSANAQDRAASLPAIHIMSYNVRNGIGMDNVKDLSRTVATIKGHAPQFVCIQELDSCTGRSGGQYVLGELAKELNMTPTFSGAIDFMGGKYGIGLLSRQAPINVQRIALPGREERRTLLVAEFSDYVIACTHLSLTPEDQELSVPIIVEAASKYNKPFIISGDFNAQPNSKTIELFKKHFTIASSTSFATYPSDVPQDMIDYVMIYKNNSGKRMRVADAHVVEGTIASDHLPQYVTLVKSK
ncbi:MAG: endonuclease/exonuclease/phosphatase family protein [Muribaculaceae bacterium]